MLIPTELIVQLCSFLLRLNRNTLHYNRPAAPCQGFFLPHPERGYGRILNIGSTGSYMPCPYDAVYAATKAYVLSFSNGLYQELKGTGVTVTCLCPGATQTLFAEKANINDTLLFKFFVMQPEVVAAIGYNNLQKGKRVVTAGLYNKLLVLSAKLLPVSIINPIAQWMVKM